MLLKELFLSGAETFSSYYLLVINKYVPMTTELYLDNADREVETWFLEKDENSPDGAKIVVKLKED